MKYRPYNAYACGVSNYQSDLGEYFTTHQAMPSEVPVDRWEGVDGLKFIGQAYPTHALLDSIPNDIPIDVACHSYSLNMQVSSGIKNNSSPNETSCNTVAVSFNGVLLEVTGTWRSPYSSPARIRLKTKPGLVKKQHTRPLLWYPQYILSTPG
ncbi:uncharacterized protein TNCV_2774871 [Trichonephila clavipes]|nr:uncharacterized protein TNCV_2774871 [Trichonephila clavipes]